MSSSSSPTRTYHERLTPSLWLIVSAAIAAPMVSLVFVKVNPTLSLVLGGIVAVAIVAAMLTFSTVVTVSDGELRVGKAHIPVEFLDAPVTATGEQARMARGQKFQANSFSTIRGGIDGIVTVEVTDPADPTPAWVVSSRTPDRLAAAISAQQVMQRTHGR